MLDKPSPNTFLLRLKVLSKQGAEHHLAIAKDREK